MTKRIKRKKLTSESFPDRVSTWLNKRGHGVRALISAVIAMGFVCFLAVILFGFLFTISPEGPILGPINSTNIYPVSLLGLSLIGFGVYFVGWRLLIGFGEGVEPGQAAAWWVIGGLGTLLILAIIAIVAALQAAS